MTARHTLRKCETLKYRGRQAIYGQPKLSIKGYEKHSINNFKLALGIRMLVWLLFGDFEEMDQSNGAQRKIKLVPLLCFSKSMVDVNSSTGRQLYG